MDANSQIKNGQYQLHPIGTVRASDQEGRYTLEIDQAYRAGLKELDQFSHALIFWWADQMDTPETRKTLTTELPYAPGVEAGVFACRSEYRPNPIAMTTCKILTVDEERGVIQITNIDAYDGTMIVDLKAYFPVCDRVKAARIPEWLSDWPEWMPEEGLDL